LCLTGVHETLRMILIGGKDELLSVADPWSNVSIST
jgi:hypothetical protein